MLGKRGEFVARPGDDPLKLREELSVHGIVARLERLDRFLAAGDQDSEQRDFLFLGADAGALAACAASETLRAWASGEARRATMGLRVAGRAQYAAREGNPGAGERDP